MLKNVAFLPHFPTQVQKNWEKKAKIMEGIVLGEIGYFSR